MSKKGFRVHGIAPSLTGLRVSQALHTVGHLLGVAVAHRRRQRPITEVDDRPLDDGSSPVDDEAKTSALVTPGTGLGGPSVKRRPGAFLGTWTRESPRRNTCPRSETASPKSVPSLPQRSLTPSGRNAARRLGSYQKADEDGAELKQTGQPSPQGDSPHSQAVRKAGDQDNGPGSKTRWRSVAGGKLLNVRLGS
jgi:hypothetical protein